MHLASYISRLQEGFEGSKIFVDIVLAPPIWDLFLTADFLRFSSGKLKQKMPQNLSNVHFVVWKLINRRARFGTNVQVRYKNRWFRIRRLALCGYWRKTGKAAR